MRHAKGEPLGGFFLCLSNNLCLSGYLGKTLLIAAQWAELSDGNIYIISHYLIYTRNLMLSAS